jgi:hypothetical protein
MKGRVRKVRRPFLRAADRAPGLINERDQLYLRSVERLGHASVCPVTGYVTLLSRLASEASKGASAVIEVLATYQCRGLSESRKAGVADSSPCRPGTTGETRLRM